jgi:O-antigen/teichoic acid export membrane protein
MTRTRRFLGGVALGYANLVIVTVVGLWLTAFYLGRLGEHDYGLWLVVAQVLAYLALLDLGVVALLPREVAYATGADGGQISDRVSQAAGQTLTVALWQVPLVAVAAAAVLLLLPADWATLRNPLVLVLATFVVTFPTRVLQATLRGLQDLAFLGAAQTASWALGTAVGLGGIVAGFGLAALAAGWTVTQVAGPVLWAIRLRRRFPAAFPARPMRVAGEALRTRLRAAGWISITQVAQVFIAGTDLLILGRLIGPGAVVLYFCTAKLVQVLQHPPLLLTEAAQPGLAQMRTSESRERLAAVCGALTQAVLVLSGGVVCVVLGVNRGFVTWWVGAERYGGLGLTAALLAAMLLRHWSTTATYALFALGRERRIAITILADGIVTVTAQIALARVLGPLGVALGAVAGVALVSLPANLSALGRETAGVGSQLAAIAPWAWRFALGAVVALVLALSWQPAHVPGLAVATLAAGLAYGALVWPLAWHGALATYVRPLLARLRGAPPLPEVS